MLNDCLGPSRFGPSQGQWYISPLYLSAMIKFSYCNFLFSVHPYSLSLIVYLLFLSLSRYISLYLSLSLSTSSLSLSISFVASLHFYQVTARSHACLAAHWSCMASFLLFCGFCFGVSSLRAWWMFALSVSFVFTWLLWPASFCTFGGLWAPLNKLVGPCSRGSRAGALGRPFARART